MKSYLRKTLIGGLLFLIPLSILSYILFQVFKVFSNFAELVDQYIPIERIAGHIAIDLLAIILILLVCFLFGLLAKIPKMKFFQNYLETNLLIKIPGYLFFKAYTKGLEDVENKSSELDPILVRLDDNSQLGFLIEENKEGLSSVYIPGSPNPWSGSVIYVSYDRIQQLNITPRQAIQHLQQIGKNASFINGTK